MKLQLWLPSPHYHRGGWWKFWGTSPELSGWASSLQAPEGLLGWSQLFSYRILKNKRNAGVRLWDRQLPRAFRDQNGELCPNFLDGE